MAAENPVPVVLRLPGVHDAELGQVGCSSDRQKRQARERLSRREGTAGFKEARWESEGNPGHALIQRVAARYGADAVGAEIHIQAVKPYAGFVDHVGSEIVGPAYQ